MSKKTTFLHNRNIGNPVCSLNHIACLSAIIPENRDVKNVYPAIDWNQVWQEMLQENLNTRGSTKCSSFWETAGNAKDFLRSSHREGAERIQVMLDTLDITEGTRILDIGSGPGTLTIPLSPIAGHITAVEPAAPMVALLREEIRRTGVSNITVVEKHWEDIIPEELTPPYEIVIAAYSLGMSDLKGALIKMQEVCCDTIYIFFSAGKPFWEEMMVYLWPHLHQEQYHPGPKTDIIWNLLYQMGICADIKVMPLMQRNRYNSIEDAVNEYAPRMMISTQGQRDILRQYIKNRLLICDGNYCLTGSVLHTCISWKAGRKKPDFNP